MSGIGKHELNLGSEARETPYSTPEAICPYCGFEHCQADWCDVGVGVVQCGPYACPSCRASEIGAFDPSSRTEALSAEEIRTGWYAPESPPSPLANTFCGSLVDHREAKRLYDLGLLDDKPSNNPLSGGYL